MQDGTGEKSKKSSATARRTGRSHGCALCCMAGGSGGGSRGARVPANSPSATDRSGCCISGAAGNQSSGLVNLLPLCHKFAALPSSHVAVCGSSSPSANGCHDLFRPLRDPTGENGVSLASVLGSVNALSELASRKFAPVSRMCAPGGSCPILDNIGSSVSTPSDAATILAICCWHRCMKASSGLPSWGLE